MYIFQIGLSASCAGSCVEGESVDGTNLELIETEKFLKKSFWRKYKDSYYAAVPSKGIFQV